MKENYVYSDGKVISTEKASSGSESYGEDAVVGDDRIIIRDYQDNIEEIFIIENLIEELQKNEVEKILKSNKKSKRLNNKNNVYISVAVSVALLPAFIVGFNMQLLISTLMWLIFSATLIGGTYYIEKQIKDQLKNELSGIDFELIETRKELLKNIEKLANLRKIKTRDNEEILKKEKTKKVNYKEKLKELREYLDVFYNIGYNEEEFKDYYDQGTLQEELNDNYNEQHIQLVKKYFDNKKTTI